MSYGLQTPCWNCNKKETCTDASDISEAIRIIHSKNKKNGHQGSGNIILCCSNMNKE